MTSRQRGEITHLFAVLSKKIKAPVGAFIFYRTTDKRLELKMNLKICEKECGIDGVVLYLCGEKEVIMCNKDCSENWNLPCQKYIFNGKKYILNPKIKTTEIKRGRNTIETKTIIEQIPNAFFTSTEQLCKKSKPSETYPPKTGT